MNCIFSRLSLVALVTFVLAHERLGAQDTTVATAQAAENRALVVVKDSPKAIESTSLVPESLAKPHTIEFEETSLSEVADWLKEKTGMNVVLDHRSLEAANILTSEPITDSLKDAPLYLLLDRLANQKIYWNAVGGIITLYATGDERAVYAVQYNLGEQLDAEYKGDDLVDTIQATIDPDGWNENSSAVLLGDILFLRQSARNQRLVAGLLLALKTPSKRIVIDEPKEHDALRTQLNQVISIDAKDKPLTSVVAQLAEQAKIDLRLNRAALSSAGTTERLPVTIQITEQKLSAILDILTTQYQLAWQIRDGAVWLTTPEDVAAHPIVALYDVRDLCLNMNESYSLRDAITKQAVPDSWDQGAIEFAKSGIMVVRQPEAIQAAVLGLLEDYRFALRSSKRRISPDEDPEALETKFYRMPTEVADNLMKELPTLVAADTWKTDAQPKGVGTIRQLKSWSQPAPAGTIDAKGHEALVPYSVLVIVQKRKVHQEIAKTLRRIEIGDALETPGMGGGMGGFGGGLF